MTLHCALAQEPEELFEICDSEGQPLGYSKARSIVHREGNWHRSVHVWVTFLHSGERMAIFQRRSQRKDTWPGRLDVAVTGHMSPGETSLQTAVREMHEEMHYAIEAKDLREMGVRISKFQQGSIIDNEIQSIFWIELNHEPELDIVNAEVDYLCAIPISTFAQGWMSRLQHCPIVSGSRTFYRSDFMDSVDDYYTSVFERLDESTRR